MDVERTMEFILQMQAKAEVRMAKAEERMTRAEARMDRAEARMDRAEARMEKFDRRLEAMRKLVETGMRMLVKIEKGQQDLTVRLNTLANQVNSVSEHVEALTDAQRKTDRKFERLMDFWSKRRSNGHGSKQ
jgi:chromosome segregation ATPase